MEDYCARCTEDNYRATYLVSYKNAPFRLYQSIGVLSTTGVAKRYDGQINYLLSMLLVTLILSDCITIFSSIRSSVRAYCFAKTWILQICALISLSPTIEFSKILKNMNFCASPPHFFPKNMNLPNMCSRKFISNHQIL